MIDKIRESANNMRLNILTLANKAGAVGAHIGPALSIVEIMATLYCGIMRLDTSNKRWDQRDRFFLSKGHGALALYTALAEAGIITKEQLFTYEENGGHLPGQPCMNLDYGIEMSSGSLGLGLSFGIGSALAGRMKKNNYMVYVLMGDGELNEGSVWEAVMYASHQNLGNLVAIIDSNGMQSDGKTDDIVKLDLKSIWTSFGWNVIEVDGHDINSILKIKDIERNFQLKPTVVIAKTVKGKGVSFMENNNEWHHNVLTKDKLDLAMTELGVK